ncbi:similar to Saccharomyces cerevisiae YGR168C Putative protein of unknown function [Maudiozyma barnettii]|uniref:Uncharacterized protein n=1 Tax=Maudiozyma barnettii TaxID=61262 RepID=A0A8H2VHC1_9SACH|nr:Pex35p [Kazachstania barnettii]CAB4255283.1 similar to Saccharomyces cerevisiae YGR168C Putative protein of unknown function [Kazachstania barnettii]CAD1783690.1 similar to Saccharomyces cerevisiae YGR168C Putative protein of unknown function [Kazachstania barnettii]
MGYGGFHTLHRFNKILKWILRIILSRRSSGKPTTSKLKYFISLLQKSVPLLVARISYLLIKLCKEYRHVNRLNTQNLMKQLRNLAAIVSLGLSCSNSTTYGLRNNLLSWYTLIGISLAVSSFEIPMWLIVYLATEWFQEIVKYLDDSIFPVWSKVCPCSIDTLKQILLNTVVILSYYRQTRSSRMRIMSRSLYGESSSFINDFFKVYAVMNMHSMYKTIKRFIMNKRTNSKRIRQYYKETIAAFHDPSDLPRPVMNKFLEIYELSLEKRSSIKEKLLGSFVIRNIQPCVKWAIWRLMFKMLVRSKSGIGKSMHLSDYFIQIVVMAQGFNMLNNNKDMQINANLLKLLYGQLGVSILNNNIDLSNKSKKLITLLLSAIEYSKYQSIIDV